MILFWPKKWQRRVPGSIVALVLGTVNGDACSPACRWKRIGSKFGGIPQALPRPHIPAFSWENIQHLFQPATTIALLAAIESLLCAVVADGMIDDRHDSNQELMAQGIANMVSPLFGGIAATGAIARTATNIKCGARSPDRRCCSRGHAAGDYFSRCAAGEIHSAGHVERGVGQRGAQHG